MTIIDNGEHVVKERLPESVTTFEAPRGRKKVEKTIPPKPAPPYQLAGIRDQCATVFPDKDECANIRMDLDDPHGVCELCAWKAKYGHLE